MKTSRFNFADMSQLERAELLRTTESNAINRALLQLNPAPAPAWELFAMAGFLLCGMVVISLASAW